MERTPSGILPGMPAAYSRRPVDDPPVACYAAAFALFFDVADRPIQAFVAVLRATARRVTAPANPASQLSPYRLVLPRSFFSGSRGFIGRPTCQRSAPLLKDRSAPALSSSSSPLRLDRLVSKGAPPPLTVIRFKCRSRHRWPLLMWSLLRSLPPQYALNLCLETSTDPLSLHGDSCHLGKSGAAGITAPEPCLPGRSPFPLTSRALSAADGAPLVVHEVRVAIAGSFRFCRNHPGLRPAMGRWGEGHSVLFRYGCLAPHVRRYVASNLKPRLAAELLPEANPHLGPPRSSGPFSSVTRLQSVAPTTPGTRPPPTRGGKRSLPRAAPADEQRSTVRTGVGGLRSMARGRLRCSAALDAPVDSGTGLALSFRNGPGQGQNAAGLNPYRPLPSLASRSVGWGQA